MTTTSDLEKHILRARAPGLSEAEIQRQIANLLEALGAMPIISQQVGGRQADIHCSEYNLVLETKKGGSARPDGAGSLRNENQLGQLSHYVLNLRNSLHAHLDLEGIAHKNWTGILTDATSGFVYQWQPHDPNPVFCEALSWTSSDSPISVIAKLRKILGDTPVGKPWAPLRIYDRFAPYENRFRDLYFAMLERNDPSLKTKFDLWLERMRASGMAPSVPQLQSQMFVKHCFLIVVAKSVIAALTNQEQQRPHPHRDSLEDGFISWISDIDQGNDHAATLFQLANSYNWRLQLGDVLRNLYEDCIPRTERQLYGEYYTPDWLAEQLTEIVLDAEWIDVAARASLTYVNGDSNALNAIGVLDPTCGSGTFLYHAALRIANNARVLRDVEPNLKARAIAALVNGIDIHPVAVEMAKATLLRALPQTSTPLPLNVYQGDSLLAYRGRGAKAADMFEDEIRLYSPKGATIRIPHELAEHPDFSELTYTLVDCAKNYTPPIFRNR